MKISELVDVFLTKPLFSTYSALNSLNLVLRNLKMKVNAITTWSLIDASQLAIAINMLSKAHHSWGIPAKLSQQFY